LTFVDDHAAGKRGDIKVLSSLGGSPYILYDQLTQYVQLTFEIFGVCHACRPRYEKLYDIGLYTKRRRPQALRVYRNLPESKEFHPAVCCSFFDDTAAQPVGFLLLR